ncbi:hypothetical protein H7F33_08780 [Pedobacter sp. PAMC26386]|nr:hypothetical protein H7F33_08780 [Pedobacter sp. PAMC26386]
MSFLTPEGAKIAQLSKSDKLPYADKLLSGGENISRYNEGVCHDVVAFALYMFGAEISPSELAKLFGQNWLHKFNYSGGQKWDGSSAISKGKAIGFYRIIDESWFHSAITIENGTEIRSVNGQTLGTSWLGKVDLKRVLGPINTDGTFNYDRTKIEVYISAL